MVLVHVVRVYGEAFVQSRALRPDQRGALRDIERRRTAVLGGHLDVCTACGHERPSYNSCRDRHCPKWQSLSQLRWIEKRTQRILPVHYFPVVFTRKRFLFAVRVMGALFRGKMLAALEHAHALGHLDLGGVEVRALRR